MFSKGDPHLLEQILLNLVLNARDALRAHEDDSAAAPVISVSWRAKGDKISICVADNGPGIPAEHQSRIFEPFFTTKKGGTGLGLSLSFSMARQMGGSLSLMSRRSGASFLIELPLAQSSEEEAADAPASAAE